MHVPNFVAYLLTFLLSCPESETATTAFTTKPPNPTTAEEGKSFTLEWTYTLDGTVVIAQFYNTTGGGSVILAKAIGTGNVSADPQYEGQFSGHVTNTKAELTIQGIPRSELLTCRFALTPTGAGSLTDIVEITIHYSSGITGLSGETTIIEGGNVTLECRAVGNPKPNITWARLPDNSDVAMPLTNITEQNAGMYYSCPLTQSCTLPLTNISRHDAGMFRCTADNGVGSPATGDVLLVVEFGPENAFLSTNLSTVPVVCAGMVANFTCTVEASNPAVDTFTLYENDSIISSKTDSGVWIKTVDTHGEVTYKCQANNSVGTSSSSNISFTVGVRASAAVESNSIVVTEGQDVNLVCSDSGFPSPNTLWVNVSNLVMDNGRILSLYNISRTMAGQYTCSARNSCGIDSQKVDLVVQYPPEVNGSGRNATVAGSAEHTFSCPVDGNPVPSITWYHVSVSREAYTGKQFKTSKRGCYICVARNIHGVADNITQCLFINSSLPTIAPNTGQSQTMVSSITVSQTTSQIMVSSTTASQDLISYQGPSSSSTTPPKARLRRWIIIIVVVGGVVLLAVLVGVLTWWVHKQRKCRKDTKIHNSDLGRHDDQGGHSQVPGAYAQSGPPAANGPDGAAEQEIEVAGAIPTYAVVNKSKKSKKQADEKRPEYAIVDKSKKKEEQEAAAIPTYAAVDKSKKKKKSREEVPPVYAEVDKSKKKKKKKIDDKNLYENLDEPKKEKKPGELLYADLGDFQNPSMPAVSISPQPLPAIKKADPYERTDYADITQFLKGNATLPPNDGNGDTEMKPKRPSKKKEIQGNDKETPI